MAIAPPPAPTVMRTPLRSDAPSPGSAGARDLLAGVGLFAGVPEADLSVLAGALRRRRYPRGTVIFMEGDPGTTLFIIESGTVKIALSTAEGKELVIALLGQGEFFGDMAILDGEPRSAD